MAKRSRKSKPKKNLTGMAILGAGLVLVGLAAFLLLPGAQADSVPSAPASAQTIPVEVDFAAPSLTLMDLQGVLHTLEDYRGQVVLVNLWATWCPPCKAEMPTLQEYYESHADDGFMLVAINDGDPKEDVVTFANDYGLTFPVWLDPNYDATERAFKTLNLPSSFVIDRNGTVRLRWVGEIKRETLEKYVTPLVVE